MLIKATIAAILSFYLIHATLPAAAVTVPVVKEHKTIRLFICDPKKRPNHPQGNTLTKGKATVIMNESFCRIT